MNLDWVFLLLPLAKGMPAEFGTERREKSRRKTTTA